jgi:hypothetical protein
MAVWHDHAGPTCPGDVPASGTFEGKRVIEAWFRRYLEQFAAVRKWGMKASCQTGIARPRARARRLAGATGFEPTTKRFAGWVENQSSATIASCQESQLGPQDAWLNSRSSKVVNGIKMGLLWTSRENPIIRVHL